MGCRKQLLRPRNRGTLGYVDDIQQPYFKEIEKMEGLGKMTQEYAKTMHTILKELY